MEDVICAVCNNGFEGVPKKDIYNFKCKCKDSKYHPGCIKSMHDYHISKNKTTIICPVCRQKKVKVHNINKYLGKLSGANSQNFIQSCMDIFNESYDSCKSWCKGITYLKSDNKSCKHIKRIQIISLTISMIWYIYAIFRVKELYDTQIYNEQTEKCSNITNIDLKHQCNNNVQNSHSIGYLVIYMIISVFVVSIIHITRVGNMIEFIILIICMILETTTWYPLLKDGLYDDIDRTPLSYSLIIFIFYLIIGIILYILILILTTIWTNYIYPIYMNYSIKHNIDTHDKIRNFVYKDGFDYEDERLEKQKLTEDENKDENNNTDHVSAINEFTHTNTGDIMYI